MLIRLFSRPIAGALLCAFAVLAAATWTGARAADSGRRVALVVGNSAYRGVQPLVNPANDARLVARTLRALGFTVIGGDGLVDLDRARFADAVNAFAAALPGANLALFYYAGHGMQVQGANWLVPIDARLRSLSDLEPQLINAAGILKAMGTSGATLNVVILDACRDNPFPRFSSAGGESGLAQMQPAARAFGRGLGGGGDEGPDQAEPPGGTVIAFATQPGAVAQDGTGADSPFTISLVQTIRQPGLDVLAMFNRVGIAVKRATRGAQQPWVSASPIDGEFFFAGGQWGAQPIAVPTPVLTAPAALPPAAQPTAVPSPTPVVASPATQPQAAQPFVSDPVLLSRISANAGPRNIPLPESIDLVPAAPDVPQFMSQYLGAWGPALWVSRRSAIAFILVVESVNSNGTALVLMLETECYSPACAPWDKRVRHVMARFQDGALTWTSVNNKLITFRLQPDGSMIGAFGPRTTAVTRLR